MPIDSLSPSALNNLLACPARVAFARSDATSGWMRGSTRAALGNVAHRLYAAAAHGNPTSEPTQAWLRATWDEFAAEQERILRAQWPGRPIPAPKDWPGYAFTKVRLIQRLTKTTGQVLPRPVTAPQSDHAGWSPALPWIERKLQDGARGLFGTPDRVERVDGALRVVDLKSGIKQAEVTDAQTRQLLFYAHLVEVEIGELPSEGVIVDAKGSETEVEVTRNAVSELLQQIAESVRRFNSEAKVGAVIARPAPDACRWCPFRVECRAYWECQDESWPSSGDRVGHVLEVEGTEIRLSPLFPATCIGSEVRVLNVREYLLPRVGDVVCVVDTDSAGVKALRMRWDSRLRTIPAGDAP